MGRPFTRHADRCNQFVRQWQLLLALRRGPKTLAQLAKLFGCHQRTIRRDLYALQAVPLPVTSRFAANEGRTPPPLRGRWIDDEGKQVDNTWSIGPMPEWPRSEELPVTALEAW